MQLVSKKTDILTTVNGKELSTFGKAC